jgi:hypothetical protein
MAERDWDIKPDLKTISSRFIAIVQHSGMKPAAVARLVGLSHTALNNIYDMDDISVKTVNKILKSFPEISESWFLSGSGEMFKEKSTEENTSIPKVAHTTDTIVLDTRFTVTMEEYLKLRENYASSRALQEYLEKVNNENQETIKKAIDIITQMALTEMNGTKIKPEDK